MQAARSSADTVRAFEIEQSHTPRRSVQELGSGFFEDEHEQEHEHEG